MLARSSSASCSLPTWFTAAGLKVQLVLQSTGAHVVFTVLYCEGMCVCQIKLKYTCADALKYRMNENRHTDKCLNSNLPKYVTFCIFADDNHNLRAVVPARNSHENTIALHA